MVYKSGKLDGFILRDIRKERKRRRTSGWRKRKRKRSPKRRGNYPRVFINRAAAVNAHFRSARKAPAALTVGLVHGPCGERSQRIGLAGGGRNSVESVHARGVDPRVNAVRSHH